MAESKSKLASETVSTPSGLLSGPAKRWPGLRLCNKHTGAVDTVRIVMGTTVYFDVSGYPWSTRSVRTNWEPANS